MRIQIVSDLHLEFSDVFIKNEANADVLILGGDIMVAQDLHDHLDAPSLWDMPGTQVMGRRQESARRYRDFLKRCSFQFPHVIYIAGNHEFYNGKFYAGIDYLREECLKFPNVYFLENDTKVIDDVVFMGATLWTDMNKGDPLTLHAIRDMMNDFRVIKNDRLGYTSLKPSHAMERHKMTKNYFNLVLEQNKDKKCVVVGHHTPSFLSVHEQYKNEYIMNGGYTSDLSEFILDHPQIVLWTHGHTHHCFDYMVGTTRVVCNPRGYENDGYSEQTGWDPNKIVEI